VAQQQGRWHLPDTCHRGSRAGVLLYLAGVLAGPALLYLAGVLAGPALLYLASVLAGPACSA